MNTFTYSPTAYKVAETYQNYNTGGAKQILVDNEIVQFKSDTDNAFRQVQNVLQDHYNALTQLRFTIDSLRRENQIAFQSLAWLEHHYPEAMHALDCTMKATVALDKANEVEQVMEAP